MYEITKYLTESYHYTHQTLYDDDWLKSHYISISTTVQIAGTYCHKHCLPVLNQSWMQKCWLQLIQQSEYVCECDEVFLFLHCSQERSCQYEQGTQWGPPVYRHSEQ